MKHQQSLNLLNKYPYQIIIFKNKLLSKEEMSSLIHKLERKNINPQDLLQALRNAMLSTSNWKEEMHKEIPDWENELDKLL